MLITIVPNRPALSVMSVIVATAVMRSPALTGSKYCQSLPPSRTRSNERSNGNSGRPTGMDLRNVGGATRTAVRALTGGYFVGKERIVVSDSLGKLDDSPLLHVGRDTRAFASDCLLPHFIG